MADDGGKLIVAHDQPREPKPGRPDLAEQGSILIEAGILKAAKLEGRGQRIGRRRRLAHFEISDDGRQLVWSESVQAHDFISSAREAAGSSGWRRHCRRSSVRTKCRGRKAG